MIYFFILIISFVIVYLTTPDIRYIALRLAAVDKRNHRKIHTKVVAQLGGLAIYFGMLGGVAMIAIFEPVFFGMNFTEITGLVMCSTLMLILGIFDDFHGSGALTKFFVQIFIALLLIKAGFVLDRIYLPGLFDIKFGGLAGPITILWLVGITNAVNLIDGLDGLASGVAAVISIFFCLFGILLKENLVIYISLALLGANLAFLKYNFYPAKIFMGDTGSLFLGFVIGSIAIYRHTAERLNTLFFPAVIVLFLPILDTVLAIIRRALRKQPIFKGDSCHIHHYYLKLGLDQRQVAARFYIITFCLGVGSLLVLWPYLF